MSYYLSYTLGLRPDQQNGWEIPPHQKKADKGSIVHKALELLASKKLAEQEGHSTFSNDEIKSEWDTEKFSVEDAINTAWTHYTDQSRTTFVWTQLDYKDVNKWVHSAITMSGGLFNPLNREVIKPEQYFDFTIEKDWAKYNYGDVSGYLSLKGTIDLTVRVNDDPKCMELIDWKTGMRKDWATGKQKDWQKLRNDPQLRLYHYALSRLYPDIEHVIVTIVWIQDGGPFSLDFGKKDLEITEKMLSDRMNIIRDCRRPKRIRGDKVHGWKCNKLCVFGRNIMPESGNTVCDHIHNDMIQLGLDRVTEKYGKSGAYNQYGSGGGVSDRDGGDSK